MYYLFLLFSGSWHSHYICCVIRSDGFFFFLFLSLLDLSTVSDTVVDMVVHAFLLETFLFPGFCDSLLSHIPSYSGCSFLVSYLNRPASIRSLNIGAKFRVFFSSHSTVFPQTLILMSSLKFTVFPQLSPNASVRLHSKSCRLCDLNNRHLSLMVLEA